jgi:hypothetical protein
VTAERGAHFHPTIGSVTPMDLSLATPKLKPRCFENQSLTSSSTEVRDEGYSPSPNTEIDRDGGYSPSHRLISIFRDQKSLFLF